MSRTIKLKKKLQKNIRQNKTSKNKMIGGNKKRKDGEEKAKIIRSSERGLPTLTIPVIYLGKGDPTTASYNNQNFGDEDKKDIIPQAVEKIQLGYQIVCIPMPPHESHSIIVNMVSDNSVKIVDWGGNQIEKQDEIKNRINEIINEKQEKISKKKLEKLEDEQEKLEKIVKKWYNYTTFINSLKSKFVRLEYEPKDEDADIQACIRYNTNKGQGGCSEYVHNWLELHVGKDNEGNKIQTLLFTPI